MTHFEFEELRGRLFSLLKRVEMLVDRITSSLVLVCGGFIVAALLRELSIHK